MIKISFTARRMGVMKNTCCFFGHQKIHITDALISELHNILEKLIIHNEVNTFLFGNKSEFNDLCYQIVSEIRVRYPYIKRIYVRAHFPHIDDSYKSYLLQGYEETYYPTNIIKAGKLAYIMRNREMIDKSEFCVVYLDENYIPIKQNRNGIDLTVHSPKSGTKLAYDYALKKQRTVINIFRK